jgi:Cu(I)/Ag(I) efflux system protein CusF
MTRISILIIALAAGGGFALPGVAADGHQHHAAAAPAAAASAWVDGEVRKIDKAKGELTIKHGPMPKFDMPAMTMAYRVKDKAMLEQLKPGDKIRFDADGVGGAFTVLRVEKLK